MAKTSSFDEHAVEYDAWFDQNPDCYKVELEGQLLRAELTGFVYRQALSQDESSHRGVKDGYESGGLVVVRATKIQEVMRR